MAAITDYDTLQAEVAAWLNRADLTAEIPGFIQLAEASMNLVVRNNEMIARETSTCDNGYVNMPANWLETISLMTTGSPPRVLEFVRNEDLNHVRANEVSGVPRVYTILNNKFFMFPEPTSDLTVEMQYYEKIPALSDSNTTNWLLDKHPGAYLYGALAQAEPYLKNDERLVVWANLYSAVLEAMRMASERAKYPQGNLHKRRRTFG